MYSFIQFRNQYDSDVTTWSPQGRLHQVEYAMEAVKQVMLNRLYKYLTAKTEILVPSSDVPDDAKLRLKHLFHNWCANVISRKQCFSISRDLQLLV